MPKGGAVQLACAKQDGRLLLNVSDQGPGFPKSKAAALFRPFYTTKPHGRGTGLGLTIARSTMQAHGGSLELRSAPGEGTTVLLRFPAMAEPGPDVAD